MLLLAHNILIAFSTILFRFFGGLKKPTVIAVHLPARRLLLLRAYHHSSPTNCEGVAFPHCHSVRCLYLVMAARFDDVLSVIGLKDISIAKSPRQWLLLSMRRPSFTSVADTLSHGLHLMRYFGGTGCIPYTHACRTVPVPTNIGTVWYRSP